MIDFLSVWWPVILCLLGGAALFVVEALMPGFGVAGVAGIAVSLGGVIWAFLNHGISAALIVLLIAVVVCACAAFFSFHSLSKGRLNSIVLSDAENPDAGSADPSLIGQEGVALTVLRPAGTVRIGERKLDAVTEGDFIPEGAAVTVTDVRSAASVVVSRKA